MRFMKQFTAFILSLALLLSLGACGVPQAAETATEAPSISYTVKVHSAGGMALPGVDVYIYADDTLTDLVQYGETEENGSLTLSMAESDSYAITLSGLADGYEPEALYRFENGSADIAVTSAPIQGENLSGAVLGLGDVMYDFTVTTPEGQKITLSEMLKEKDMVLLNFWYTTCTWCVKEFPFMQEAYEAYSDKVGIIALNPLEQEAVIPSFQAQMELTFPMAACPPAWSAAFGITGYPTSVVVDRYGVICLVEAGGITSLRPFTSIFDYFTAEDYQQTLYGSLSELVTTAKPNVVMESSEAVSAVLDGGKAQVTYRPEEGNDAEYAWPFIITEKNGESCLKASNQGMESSFAILYMDVSLKKGEAVRFDYLTSTEKGADILYVIVDDQPVYQISGFETEGRWQTCCPWVAAEDGTYEVALCYIKDGDTNEADDTVYLKNLQIVGSSEINTPTYIPRNAAVQISDLEYEYVDIVLNEEDGYYHVGTADGPLLMADLMGYTQFNEEKTIWELVYDGDVSIGGKNYYDDMVNYFSYASNSAMNGCCTVNDELLQWLLLVDDTAGFDPQDDREWLKACKYYEVYGTTEQMRNPVQGLYTFAPFKAKLGSDNSFYYDRPIMPRGLLAEFVPEKSGVYRITSRSDSEHGVEGWIFDSERTNMYTYEPAERLYTDNVNVSMVYYMEAGKSYYIDIAFWDIYEVGTIYYTIEYVAPKLDLFRTASPGFFTYDTNATGDQMYALIAGGIDVMLGEDGKYYEKLGVDKDGKPVAGSLIYCDFTGITGVFSQPIATVDAYNQDGTLQRNADGTIAKVKGMIDMGGFDFSKTEGDLYILGIMEKYGNDIEKTDAYLREYWGTDYDANAEEYQLEDVFEGRFHGRGEDLTEEMRGYLDEIITSGKKEQIGCVVVTERLAEILQMLMDKYTFENVDHSWTKLCYYYQHIGP